VLLETYRSHDNAPNTLAGEDRLADITLVLNFSTIYAKNVTQIYNREEQYSSSQLEMTCPFHILLC
jgi:hypothetical protein